MRYAQVKIEYRDGSWCFWLDGCRPDLVGVYHDGYRTTKAAEKAARKLLAAYHIQVESVTLIPQDSPA